MINFADKQEVAKAAASIYHKHCRKYPKSQRPIHCVPSFEETIVRDSQRLKKKQKKLIYDSKEIAEQCALEITQTCGLPIQRAYPCPRSHHGHYHLTNQKDIPTWVKK